MKPSDVFYDLTHRTGFYNIMPLVNIPSVLTHGILSNELANTLPHKSVAMGEIQDRRDRVSVPNGLKLHKYANVYFDARNPMMYKRQSEEICVLKISARILDLPNVVIADRNASSSYVRFYEPNMAFDRLNFDLIYAKYWTSPDPFEQFKNKSIKCAEILVPEMIPSQYIIAVAVKNSEDKQYLLDLGIDKRIYIDQELFFR